MSACAGEWARRAVMNLGRVCGDLARACGMLQANRMSRVPHPLLPRPVGKIRLVTTPKPPSCSTLNAA